MAPQESLAAVRPQTPSQPNGGPDIDSSMSLETRAIATRFREVGGVHVASDLRALEAPMQRLLDTCLQHRVADQISARILEGTERSIRGAMQALPGIAAGLESGDGVRVREALQLFQKHEAVFTTVGNQVATHDRSLGALFRRTVERLTEVAQRLLSPKVAA